jgi:leader peptidase (prepilin peptidase)/N-methyltransferase
LEFLFFFGCIGLLIGSFFNVVIWRYPRHESIMFPASHCPQCNRKIRPWENIPVLSYIFLMGKCAGCKNPISIIYPIIELLTGIGAALLWTTLIIKTQGEWFQYIIVAFKTVFLLTLIPLAVIDFKYYIIPDWFNLPMIIAGLAISFIPGDLSPLQSITGLLSGGGSLYLVGLIGKFLFKKEDSMGGGDIKLMAAAGALFGAPAALMGIMFGAFLGSVGGLLMMRLHKTDQEHRIPFGPFLGAGLWISVIAGNQLLNAYLSLIS